MLCVPVKGDEVIDVLRTRIFIRLQFKHEEEVVKMLRKILASNILKPVISARFFFLISGVGFIWSSSIIWTNSLRTDERLLQEAIENVGRDINYINVYRKPSKLPKEFKYILLWTPKNYSPFYFFGTGQKAFIENNCSFINCYVSVNRYLFGGDLSRFDAIAFNGRNMVKLRTSWLPQQRSMSQKYLFVNLESADNYPVCSEKYEGYFNWTATYKLNSDIPYPYLMVRNSDGEVVGPKRNMKWIQDDPALDEELSLNPHNKTRAIAWFVSNCADRSGRRDFVWFLASALAMYKLSIDVFGKCGNYSCPLKRKEECDAILERDYYFYLAMENSFADDYVTEKVLTALQNNIVPIVYGAANYSCFLPPGSYIDARGQDVHSLAATIADLINSPKLYSRYFQWKRHYTYHDPTATDNVCAICAALHNQTLMETHSVYNNFREWWHPQFKKRCWWIDDDEMAAGL